jgi:hypothetical protein
MPTMAEQSQTNWFKPKQTAVAPETPFSPLFNNAKNLCANKPDGLTLPLSMKLTLLRYSARLIFPTPSPIHPLRRQFLYNAYNDCTIAKKSLQTKATSFSPKTTVFAIVVQTQK